MHCIPSTMICSLAGKGSDLQKMLQRQEIGPAVSSSFDAKELLSGPGNKGWGPCRGPRTAGQSFMGNVLLTVRGCRTGSASEAAAPVDLVL